MALPLGSRTVDDADGPLEPGGPQRVGDRRPGLEVQQELLHAGFVEEVLHHLREVGVIGSDGELRSANALAEFTLPETIRDVLSRRLSQLSATAKLLLAGDEAPPSRLEQVTVLRVPTAELADGIVAWAETRDLIRERLAPTLLAVPAEAVEPLLTRLGSLGVRVEGG